MEDVNLQHAKEHLEELIARAARGEDVRIAQPGVATVKLIVVETAAADKPKPERRPGRWKDRLPNLPDDFFDPLPEEELKHWYGDDK